MMSYLLNTYVENIMDNTSSQDLVSQANGSLLLQGFDMHMQFISAFCSGRESGIQKLSGFEICSKLRAEHESYMDKLDIIVTNKAETTTHGIEYKNFLNCIMAGLLKISHKRTLDMSSQQNNINCIYYLIKQIKSRHLTELEEKHEYLRPAYNAVIEKASKMIATMPVITSKLPTRTRHNAVIEKSNEIIATIPAVKSKLQRKIKPISVVKSKLQEIISKIKSTLFRANAFLSVKTNEYNFMKDVGFDELHEKIKDLIEHYPFEDYDNQIELQIAYPQLISLKQQIVEIKPDFFSPEANKELSSIIEYLDTLISNAPEPESTIDTKPNDEYLTLHPLLQERKQLCAI